MSVRATLRTDQEQDLQKALALNGRLCLLGQPRTGKTRLALAITEALNCQRVLLVGFNSFLPSWEYEMIALEESGNPFHLPFEILNTGTVLSRALKMRQIRRSGQPHMFAVNFESFWRSDLRQAIRDWQPDMVIYDEAHRLISRGTKAARFAHQIARSEKWFKHCLVLTATYQEHAHTDLFSLFKACDPDVFGLDYQAFADAYTVTASHMCKTCGTLVSSIRQLPRTAPACEPETGWHKGYFLEIKHHCQPVGTVVTVRRNNKFIDIPIEQAQPGDIVPAYSDGRHSKIYTKSRYIKEVQTANYCGQLVCVSTSLGVTRYTPNHRVVTNFSKLGDKECVYLMKKGTSFRIGLTKIAGNGRVHYFGPASRLKHENADAVWILSMYDTRVEAMIAEHKISGMFGIPELVFSGDDNKTMLTDDQLNDVWAGTGNLTSRAKTCLDYFGRDITSPLIASKDCTQHKIPKCSRFLVTCAANLMSGMSVLPFLDRHISKKNYVRPNDWIECAVYREHYSGPIYSFDIEGDYYVADGLITHNSIIGYKNEQELFDQIKKHSVRRTQQEVNILPPVNTIIPVHLSENTRAQYDKFMSTYVHQFRDKNNQALDVFARIALSALVKAQELTGGWIQDDRGKVLDISTEKLDLAVEAVTDDLRNNKRPALYARFNNDVLRLAKALKIDPKWTYTSFAGNGDKGIEQRKDILRQLLRGNLETLIGNGRMISYGLNLSMMDTANFFSTSYSSIEFEQLCGRLQARDKQPFHRHFCAVDTVDEDVYKALSTKTELRLKVFDEKIVPFESIDDIREPTASNSTNRVEDEEWQW